MKIIRTAKFLFTTGFFAYRSVLWELLYRDIVGRYKGSVLGILWSFLTPILMLGVYSFVFGVVFKARWGEMSFSTYEYTSAMFAGLLIFNFFSECATRSPNLILSNSNYVKKIVFPLQILPIVLVGSATFHFLVGLALWFVFHIFTLGLPDIKAVFVPLIIIPFIIFNLGVSWFLASLGVFLRDINQLIGVINSSLMFLSPIFYPASALPENIRWLVYFNPLTPAIEALRGVLLNTSGFTFWIWLLSSCLYLAIGWLGLFWFQKTRRAFADVI